MTTTVINNVPRELIQLAAELLGQASQYSGDSEAYAAADLNALLSAPSPAGVDGLEVVAYIWSHEKGIAVPTMRNKPPFWPGKGGYTSEPLCRLSEAQAIIDGLRGEADQQAQRIGELASHLEFAVTMLTVAGLAGNAQVEAMRAALSAGNEPKQCT